MMTTHATATDGNHSLPLSFSATAAQPRRCSCGATHLCDALLDAIQIPEEDSRLYARARVDFGQVSIGRRLSAFIVGNFNIRIHVPRALQQQISGNSLVGTVLGNARISADISERVGSIASQRCSNTEVCLFVDFHEEQRGAWMVDLRVLSSSKLHAPVHVEAIGPQHDPMQSFGLAPITFELEQDLIASYGPITIPSRSVLDLWRSVRDQVRDLLCSRIARVASVAVVGRRTALVSRFAMGHSGGLACDVPVEGAPVARFRAS